MIRTVAKDGYDRVPLVSADKSDTDSEEEHYMQVPIRKRKSVCTYRLQICAGILIIFLLLAVIGAMTYILMFKSKSENTTTAYPSLGQTNSFRSTSLPDLQQATTRTPPTLTSTKHQPTNNWELTMDGLGSECVIRLIDIDGDGLQDIVFGAAKAADLNEIAGIDESGSLRKFCKSRGEEYPCLGTLFGIRGYDGKVLWKLKTRSGGLLINCVDFDINLDGHKDCIITGRQSTIEAIDVTKGKHLWMGDTKFLTKTWNIYQAMALPDFNSDGVNEVLIMHGGNPNIDALDHNRESGRLIMLDGKTGKVMGLRYLKMPNNRESYQSPVVYTCADGSQYIVFGSGGETVSGDLMLVSVPDFYRYVMGLSRSARVPNTRGSYGQWKNVRRQRDTGIMVIFRGTVKGVMVPPLMTDINHDGADDIIMSAYEGRVALFDGKTMKASWIAEFPAMESYSTPAPGYFDDDDILDFMVHWSKGAWPFYNASEKVIINGKDGSIMWRLKLKNYEMSSDLTLQTTEPHRDIFLFKIKGRNANVYQDISGEIHGVGLQRNISIAEEFSSDDDFDKVIYEDYRKHSFLCDTGVDIKSEIFMMDRRIALHPIKVMESGPINYKYHPVISYENEIINKNLTFCTVLIPEDRTTAAIGDVDGDGTLDLVTMTGHTGKLVDQHFSFDRMIYNVGIQKINLQPLLKNKTARTTFNAETSLPLEKYESEKDTSQLTVLPLEQQQWLAYFGAKENGHFINKR